MGYLEVLIGCFSPGAIQRGETSLRRPPLYRGCPQTGGKMEGEGGRRRVRKEGEEGEGQRRKEEWRREEEGMVTVVCVVRVYSTQHPSHSDDISSPSLLSP